MSNNNSNIRKQDSKAKKVGIIVAVIAAALVIILLNVFNYVKDSGFVERRTVAVKSENFSFSESQMTYYFYNQYMSFANQFTSYGISIDTSKSLTEQQCIFATNQTWYEYFMTSAISNAKSNLALAEAAKAAGIEVTDADRQTIDASIENMEKNAKASGYEKLETYLKANYGACVNEKDIRGALEIELLGALYLEKVVGDTDVSTETLEAKYAASPDTYDKIDYLKYVIDYTEIEKALEAKEKAEAESDETADSETKVETDADREAAAARKAEAMKLAEEWKVKFEAADTDDTFKNTVKEYLKTVLGKTDAEVEQKLKDNPIEVEGASLKENDEILKWAFEEGRAVGDLKVFEKKETHEHSEDEAEDAHDNLGTIYTAIRMVKTRGKDTEITGKDVRHILFSVDTYKDDAKAQEIYNKVKGGVSIEEFEKLVKEYSEDPGSITTGGLYENVTKGQMVTEFDNWLFAEDRKVGDYGLVKTTHGWHVMYLEAEKQGWEVEISNELQNKAAEEASTAANDKYEVEVKYDVLADIKA